MTQTPIANVRCSGSRNMLRISDSVDGASVAPATPSSARVAISIAGAGREGRQDRGDSKGGGADQEQPPPPDSVAQRAHGDQRSGDQESVDVENPEQLSAAGLQVGADVRAPPDSAP